MDWIILFIGSLCEVGWLIGMKYSSDLHDFGLRSSWCFSWRASVGA